MLPVAAIRDKSMNILGYIEFEYESIKLNARFNNVGYWELRISSEHPYADIIRQPGNGIVCFFNGRVVSGWTRSAEVSESSSDPQGTWVVRGVTDEVLLAARETYPNPLVAADVQDTDYYNASGVFETVAKDLVDLNLGGGALVSRQLVSVAPDLARGAGVKISSRFKPVLDELQALAIAGGNMGFNVYQDDDELFFDVYEPVDRSREIQLDVENGGLSSAGWGYEAPSVSNVLVAGQGSGAERTILPVSTPESEAAALEWGFSIERFKDQRNTDDPAELLQSGLQILSEGGLTGRVISMEPSGAPALKPGTAYWLGDTITVASSAGAAQAQVTEILFSVTTEGLTELITVGDPVGFNFESRMSAKVESQDRRITQLERSAEGGVPVGTKSGDVLVTGPSPGFSPVWVNPDYKVVADISERNAIVSPKNGMKVWVQSENREYTRIGGAWVLQIVTGTASIPTGGTLSGTIYYSSTITVTLPGGRFSTAPRIKAHAIAPGGEVMWCAIRSVSASSFQAVGMRLAAAIAAGAVVEWEATDA